MQAYLLWESVNSFYILLFRLFIIFTYWMKWRSLTIVNSFCKTISLCLQCLYSFQMCKSGILRNGGTKSQGDDLWMVFLWEKGQEGAILPSHCQWMQMKANFIFNIDRYLEMMNHRTLMKQRESQIIKGNNREKWTDMCGYLAFTLLWLLTMILLNSIEKWR